MPHLRTPARQTHALFQSLLSFKVFSLGFFPQSTKAASALEMLQAKRLKMNIAIKEKIFSKYYCKCHYWQTKKINSKARGLKKSSHLSVEIGISRKFQGAKMRSMALERH